MSNFLASWKSNGWVGLWVYLQLKLKLSSINFPGVKGRIFLRKGTADYKLFKLLFFHEEYKLPFQTEANVIIDAGANIGLSSLYFSKKYPSAEIFGIEPESENFNMLVKNTEHVKSIHPIHAGLWSKKTLLRLLDGRYGSTGFMVEETTVKDDNSFNAISINTLISKNGLKVIDIVKIDIEGAEREVLSANVEWLSRTKILLLELHDRKQKGCSKIFFTTLSKFNFDCFPFGQNFLLINRDLETDIYN